MLHLPELPNNPWGNDLQELVNLISQYDLVVLQRSISYPVALALRKACDILRKPLVYETDDDYLHIPPSNPAHKEMINSESVGAYIEILGMVDYITVSTEELKRVLYPFNRNIKVFPNNVETIYCGEWGGVHKAYHKAQQGPDSKVMLLNRHGMITIPAYNEVRHIDAYTKNCGSPIKTIHAFIPCFSITLSKEYLIVSKSSLCVGVPV